MSAHDPIAYTYEADYHCPACAFERFGQDEHGFVPEDAEDSEGNPIGALAPWDEWHEPTADYHQALACGTCGEVIEELDDADQLRDAAWEVYDLAAFIAGYEVCADGDEMDSGDVEGIGWHGDTLKQFADDCLEFARENVLDLVASGLDARRAGCDFWLTRNRHGAGYWDEGYRESAEINAALTRLTDAAHAYGTADLYVGDDGWIYQA